ncbi:hypothetical protein RQP46_008076 [Phenoliferia psychrophenolica]
MADPTAANTQSALLSCPNEVLDKILGHLVKSIPRESSRSHFMCKKSSQLQALETVSHVSKKLHIIALRRLFAKLVVMTGKQVRAIAKILKTGDTGVLVKEITIEGGGYHSRGVPTAAELAKRDLVTPEDVVAILHLMPKLSILRLRYIDFVRFRQRDAATLSTLPLLNTVHTLEILPSSPKENDTNYELMATLIPLFPTLHTINVSLPFKAKNPRFKTPPPRQPSLETLELAFPVSSSGASTATLFSLISVPAAGQIRTLTLRTETLGQLGHNIEDLIQQVGPGLDTLRLECRVEAIPTALLHCPYLTTLQLLRSYYRLDNFITILSSLPLTVVTLQLWEKDYIYLLEALKTTPKPAGLLRLEMKRTPE